MSDLVGQYSGLLQAGLFATVLFALAISLACAAVYPLLSQFIKGLAPARRANLLFGLAMLPLVGALAFLLLSFAPSLLAWAGLAPDHCHLHPDHPHLCLLHPTTLESGAVLMSLAFVICAAILAMTVAWAVDCWRMRRLVGSLLQLSHRDNQHGIHVVAVDTPMAFAAGLRTPELFVSRQLLAGLTAQQLAIVIAHERAHADRQDSLRQVLAGGGAWLHTPFVRRTLLAGLSMAAEQACDERAAMQTGDRLAVAEAIISVEKLFVQRVGTGTVLSLTMPVSHFIGSNVPGRIQALLAAPRPASPLSHVFLPVTVAISAGLIAFAAPLHHMTESLLGFLFH